MSLHTAAGDHARASEVIEAYVQASGDDEWRDHLEGLQHLGSGNWDGFQESTGAAEEPRDRFQHALATGDYAAGIEALVASGQQTAFDHLLVYIAARHENSPGLAETGLAAAIESLSEGSLEERTLAECLSGKRPVSDALTLTLEPEKKTVALAALGNRRGNARARELARKLNYDLSFERYFLNRLGF